MLSFFSPWSPDLILYLLADLFVDYELRVTIEGGLFIVETGEKTSFNASGKDLPLVCQRENRKVFTIINFF